jgi:hypothetical protein
MSLGVDSVGERCEQARTVAARSSGQPMAGHVGSAFGFGFESTFKKKGIVLNTQGGGNEGGSGGNSGGAVIVRSEGVSGSDQSSPGSSASGASGVSGTSSSHQYKPSLAKKIVSRVLDLKELFGLDEEDDTEDLLDTFMCALKKRILLQGRMYVFSKHVCFSCSLFGYHKLERIPIESIVSVRKRKHVGFPNSVEILWMQHADDETPKKSFFTSFLSREDAFQMITGLWSLHGGNEPRGRTPTRVVKGIAAPSKASDDETSRSASPEDSADAGGPRESACLGPGDAADPTHMASSPSAYDARSELDSVLGEMRRDELLSTVDRAQSAGEIMTPRGLAGPTEFSPSVALDDPFAELDDGVSHKLEKPPEVPPIMQKVMEYVIPVRPQEFYDLFLSSKSEFFIDYHAAQGHKNIQLSAWDYHGSMGPVRDLSFVTALKGFRIGPPEALCHQTQRVGVYAGQHIVFETSQVMSDIPYGDHFKVETRWDILANPEDSGLATGESKMIIHIAVPFTKNTMFKKFIEKGVTESLLEAYQMFKRLAAQRLEASENDADDPGAGSEASADGRRTLSNSETPLQKPHHPDDLLPQQEADWEMILDRVEPKFRSGLASLRKMQQEVARQNKFSLTKSKHRRSTSIVNMDALDEIMSDFEGKVDDNGAGVCFGGRGARAATEAQHCLQAGEAAETGRPMSLWLAPLALPLGLDARDRIYLSLIVVLLAVVLAQWCAMLWGGW